MHFYWKQMYDISLNVRHAFEYFIPKCDFMSLKKGVYTFYFEASLLCCFFAEK